MYYIIMYIYNFKEDHNIETPFDIFFFFQIETRFDIFIADISCVNVE